MSTSLELACRYAIQQCKKKNVLEVSLDHLLLGCFRTISTFGIAQIGSWNFDLEELGMDWLNPGEEKFKKVSYSQAVVDLLDLAARIARANNIASVGVEHVLAAFAGQNDGLFGRLKRDYSISSAEWRIAIAQLVRAAVEPIRPPRQHPSNSSNSMREYLTPEEASELLSIHVQTVRAHVRSGRLPALRLAGERAIRIRRTDVEKLFEPTEQAR